MSNLFAICNIIDYMRTNFEFLKKVDKNLYTIVSEAEFLYRDEYFEQCMVQTRRFGEHVCKAVLGDNRRGERTFDDMLATLKDNVIGSGEEKEFIDDLYFLKKHGNNSAHSVKVHKDGMEALECLQRAFEVAISYCVYFNGADNKILRLNYDTELLVTGEKSKKTLAEKYKEAKATDVVKSSKIKVKQKSQSSNKKKTTPQQSYKMVPKKKKKGISVFWIFVGICSIISLVVFLFMLILVHFSN